LFKAVIHFKWCPQFITLGLFLGQPAQAQTGPRPLYVKKDATGLNNGQSWTDAFRDLRLALESASTGDEIWIAEGIYTPAEYLDESYSGDPRNAVFSFRDGIRLIGGFKGFEDSVEERQGSRDKSILSGEFGDPHDRTDNFRQILKFSIENSPRITSLESLSIEDSYNELSGGGLVAKDTTGPTFYSAPLNLIDLAFRNNHGKNGGAFAVQSWRGKAIDCLFENNSAELDGGAVSINLFRGTGHGFVRTSFIHNRAGQHGGAINLVGGDPHYQFFGIVNSQFIGNSAGLSGGAIRYSSHGSDNATDRHLQIHGSLFARNEAKNGGALWISGREQISTNGTNAYVAQAHVDLRNVTIAHNRAKNRGAAIYSSGEDISGQLLVVGSIISANDSANDFSPSVFIESGESAEMHFSNTDSNELFLNGYGNLNREPRFMNAEQMDFRLRPSSPLVNQLDQNLLPIDILDENENGQTTDFLTNDLSSRPRSIEDGKVEIGAFEAVPCDTDVNRDLQLTNLDLRLFLKAFENKETTGDWNHDNLFNALDLQSFMKSFEEGCHF